MNEIAIVFIVIGIPLMIPIIGMLLQHRKQMAQLSLEREKSSKKLNHEVEELKNELKQLRETLLEHSLSLDRNVEHLKSRVENMESKSQTVKFRE
jgi:archaellum component FlaC